MAVTRTFYRPAEGYQEDKRKTGYLLKNLNKKSKKNRSFYLKLSARYGIIKVPESLINKGKGAIFLTRAELQKAYLEMSEKCSVLEKENADLRKQNEDKDLRIEHLTELVLKRNKMLFGQKSEKSKYLCEGQLTLEGTFNEAEEQANPNVPEPTVDSVEKKSKKTGQHRGRKEIRAGLETKKIVYKLPEDQRVCNVCGDTLVAYTEEYITTRIAVIPEQIYKVEYYREVYKCPDCDKNGVKANIVKAENQTPALVVEKGLADASPIADIMQRKYQFGEPLYRQEQY